MRDVNTVKEKRNQLRDELATFVMVKENKFPTPTKFKDLGDFDRRLFGYLMSCINSMRNKINALEFVLNEDTELTEYTRPSSYDRECGIDKSLILSIAKEYRDILI